MRLYNAPPPVRLSLLSIICRFLYLAVGISSNTQIIDTVRSLTLGVVEFSFSKGSFLNLANRLLNLKKNSNFSAPNELFRPSIGMITFQNKKSFPIDDLKGRDKTISTLLIPAHLVNPLKEKIKEHGNLFPVYLRNLLWMYRTLTHSGMIHPPRKLKTEYQNEGLDLQRVNLRPFNADWIELGELALAFGKSRCWMFTFLLELDILGLWEIFSKFGLGDAVPTKSKLRLKVSWSLRRVLQDFARSYHVRV